MFFILATQHLIRLTPEVKPATGRLCFAAAAALP